MPPAPLPLSNRSLRTTDSPISFFIQKAIETPGIISFAAGLVDAETLPAADVATAVADIMADPAAARAALQYGSTQGLPALREKVLRHVCDADGIAPRDLNLTADDVVLTTGSQQILYILGEVLFDPGDIVITEAPSYFVYHDCLTSHGADVRAVPMDSGGMDLDALDALLARLAETGDLKRVKLIYTVDYFQNPTGLSLTADRRPRLVEIAKKYSTTHRILILEDAAYRELRYDGPDLPSVKRYDPANEFVVYTSTFSKPCSPGLKTGYSILPRDLVTPVCNLKGSHDFGSSNLAQHILNRLMETGAYHRHVETLQRAYRLKRDAMVKALGSEFANWPGVKWTVPGGGLYVWLTFPSYIDTGKDGPLIGRAVDAGVLYVPGQFGHVPDAAGVVPKNEVRLSFGVATPEQILEGVRRLRRACRGLER
ncbi:PLP-dependent aminotransferase family protein [Fimbriiglobus ruber]|uniref:Transcriptional regulator, GntR family domain / Aspartate aminotransferase n=1 Tax=Fimbriiglobus ruber TaxID=1908690 RepID=A0A225DPB3_9BACT|nr:PLP-dependent aminotransferase family protein [Fimbriiglobus ruber]OWK43141.1 Transcriptional regulator, GntR family domain / Aspartate aminotransferase [Fimbriiglobus ruber]